MKVKKTPASKKTATSTSSTNNVPNSKISDDLAQKDEIIQRLEKELLACQAHKEVLQQTLLNYQQQPLPTLISHYQNAWHQYYINQLVLPANQLYENLLSTSLRLIAETQNQLQAKIQAGQAALLQLKQQLLAYIQQYHELLMQIIEKLKTQQENLRNNTAAIYEPLIKLIQSLQQKLPALAPKADNNALSA